MDIHEATTAYENWLEKQTEDHGGLFHDDLGVKRKEMANPDTPFPYLRATFYRWAQIFPHICPELADAPETLCVGDLHVENFGTWRNAEGRLIWGINDFDEACPMPYATDLVRLTVSAALSEGLQIGAEAACADILSGYSEGLKVGGNPFNLAEYHNEMRQMALSALGDPDSFWKKLVKDLETEQSDAATKAAGVLERAFPSEARLERVDRRRKAGLGSLGRQRFVAQGEWRGRLAMEAKAVTASAWRWARGELNTRKIYYEEAVQRSVRSPDPYLKVMDIWVVRRLAPYYRKIKLEDLQPDNVHRLLHAMGWETANIHLGTPEAVEGILKDISKRPENWLCTATSRMEQAVRNDWEDWKRI
jgi:uncharacterized protein (DUF2252 family)